MTLFANKWKDKPKEKMDTKTDIIPSQCLSGRGTHLKPPGGGVGQADTHPLEVGGTPPPAWGGVVGVKKNVNHFKNPVT